MPGFFIERAVQERLVGQVTEARLRAREIASSVTPAQMSRIQAGMQRNPTLPLSVQLALRNTDQDDLRDRIEAEYARRQSVDALYEDVQPQAPQQQNGNGFFGAVMDAAGGAKDAIGAAPGLLRQAGQAATAVPGVGSVFGAVGGQVGQVISDMPNSGFGNQVAKPIIRTGGAVLNVVPQAVQSIGRNVYAASNDQVMDRYMSAGGAMNFAQDVISQTDLGQMVAEGVRGDNPFDLGTSWYVDEQSDVYRNRLNAEINVGGVRDSGYLLYDDNGTTRRGEVFTGGRGLATILGYDPGSDGYQVISGLFDATVAVATPSIDRGFDDALRVTRGGATRLLGGTTEAQFTRAVGGYSGVVRQVDPLKVEHFLSSPSGTQVLERFAEETDFLSLWRMTGGKYEPEMVTRLADATNPAEVRSLLMENMYGLGQAPIIRSKPSTWLSRTDRRPRWTADMPTTSIDLVDSRAAVEFMDDFATHVRIGSVDRTRRGAWMEAMARAQNPIARRQVYHDALGDVASELILDDLGYGRHTIRRLVDDAAEAGGVDGGNLSQVRLAALERIAADGNSLDPADYANVAGAMRGTAAVVDQLTMYMNSIAETNRVMIDELVADGIWDWSAYQTQIGDLRLPSAFALSERASSLPAPNLRELRRATGGLRSLYFTLNDPGVMGKLSEITGLGPRQVTNSLITGTEGLQRFWKDMALLRPAYVLRVGGEEQLRMAVAGRNSMLNHPWRYISDMSGRSDFRNLGGTHLTNDEVFRRVSAGGSANGMRDTDAWSRGVMHQTRLQKGVDEPDEFLAAWLDELETIRVDEVFSRHLRSETVDETVEWLFDGGSGLRSQLEEMHSRTFDEAFTRQYVESMTRRVRDATGGNDQILNYLRGEADAPDWASLVDEFAPPVTFGNSVSGVGPTRGAAARMGEKYDKKVERWFELLAGAPTDKLARHPTFVQFYRDTLIQLAPLAENPNVVRAMQQTGLFKGRWGRSMLADLEGVVGQGTLTIAQLDHLAKVKALSATRELLYDVSRRSQFFDTYRLLFPFGEAFKEQVTTWGRLFAETPAKVSRQAGGAVQAGRDAIVSDDLGNDPGMFYVNGNGEMVFVYPGTGTLTRALTGEAREFTGLAGVAADAAGRLPGVGPLLQGAAEQLNADPSTGIEMPMTGRVAGLNMMGGTLPGAGPVVQYPAAYFLPPNPDNSWIRDVIMPFGDPGNPRDILANFAPAFARTFVMSGGGMTPDEQRRYGNSLYATLTYLESTGRYDTTNPAGIQQMKDDAQSGTTLLYWVRGTIQAFGPTSPRPEPGFVGENGELVLLAVAKDRYQVLLEEDPENAVTRWMTEFGAGGFLAMQGNTVATVAGGVPLQGQSALDWVRDNPGVRDAHPDVYGFFAPRDGSDEFNYDAYLEAIENGELEVLTVDEKYDRAQHRVASSIYNQYRRAAVEAARAGGRMTPTREQSVMLQELRRNLGEDWDGYRPEGYGVSESVTSLIDKNVIEEALANPVLAETETGQALAEYWIAHNTAMAASQVQEINDDPYGYGWRDTNEGVAIRQYLRVTGEALATEYPEFRRMWEDFLIYEFRDIADEDPDYLELIGG